MKLQNLQNLQNLLEEDELIVEFGTTDAYIPFHAIVENESDDISAALENTLHRILDNGGSEEDVYSIMGAFIPTGEEMDEMLEFEEYINIDLGYVIKGLIMYWKEEADEDTEKKEYVCCR